MKDGNLKRALSLLFILTAFAMSAQLAHGQTFTVLYNFIQQGAGGSNPNAGVTMDAAGNLYGTTVEGGTENGGTVFKLTRRNGAWILSSLYSFQCCGDGSEPMARVVFGPDGALYGTTQAGGFTGQNCPNGCGVIFSLRPPATVCRAVSCPWTETILYHFTGGLDGGNPGLGDLIFDRARNIYGTTEVGGAYGSGTVFKLSPSNGRWTENVLYSFSGSDGELPVGGVIFDHSGNLWGTTLWGGYVAEFFHGVGVVFELSPSGSGWTQTSLYKFMDAQDGGLPMAALAIDSAGRLYGTTSIGGTGGCMSSLYTGCGTVFQSQGDGVQPLYAFPGNNTSGFPFGPEAPVTVDAAGNLYGTSFADGINGAGNVFKLTNQNGGWIFTSLVDFTNTSASAPISNVVIDGNGDLYGTASSGGSGNGGVVWKIAP
jgi:uncharacterized repeat protein (TIGR03803 family)